MTPIQILENLEKTAQEKHLQYLQAGQEIARREGTLSKTDLDGFDKAKEDWLAANSTYRSFLSTFGKERPMS